MPVEGHKITVNRTAHYYSLGQPGPPIQKLWVVFHGYGLTASRIIKKFSGIQDEKTLILAPEGLSKFYFQGFTGEVGASWMTRENRLDEIEDYCAFIQTVYEKYTPELSRDVQINILGFSQGGATACRWLMKRKPHFHNLVLWASDFPKDLDFRSEKQFLDSKLIYFVFGDSDKFIPTERKNDILEFVRSQEIQYRLIEFKGGHEIDRRILTKLSKSLEDSPD